MADKYIHTSLKNYPIELIIIIDVCKCKMQTAYQQLSANFAIMDKLFNILVFLLPFVVESVLVKNDLHILRKKILGRNIYDRHVKPDGKIDVSFGIDIMDMNFCPHKHVNNISLFIRYSKIFQKIDQ